MDTSDVNAVLEKHKDERGGLISILEDIQGKYGYLPEEALKALAEKTNRSLVDIYGVVTFYKSFSLQPRGKHLISVCMGTACHLAGGKLVMEAMARELDIEVGEVSEDREFSLDRVACIGCCALAPVVTVGDSVYPRMTPPKVEEVLVTIKPATSEKPKRK